MFESLELKTQLNKLMKTKRVNKRLVYVSKGLFTFDFCTQFFQLRRRDWWA